MNYLETICLPNPPQIKKCNLEIALDKLAGSVYAYKVERIAIYAKIPLRCAICGETNKKGCCAMDIYCSLCKNDFQYCYCLPDLFCDFCGMNHLKGKCKHSCFTPNIEQELMSLKEADNSRIEESEVKKKDEDGNLIKNEDDLVWKETQKYRLWGGEYVQQEIPQHKNIPQIFFSSKVVKREEIDEVLDAIYALFINSHLKKIWKKHHLYLKFMEFLPNKMKKKDDVFFVSYMPP
jgi:hypothetical protein